MDNTKRIILIQGEGSKWYEQAIFIINSSAKDSDIPKDFVKEAENIVRNYAVSGVRHQFQTVYNENAAKKTKAQKPAKKNRALDFFLNIAVIVCCVVLALLLNNIIFR